MDFWEGPIYVSVFLVAEIIYGSLGYNCIKQLLILKMFQVFLINLRIVFVFCLKSKLI